MDGTWSLRSLGSNDIRLGIQRNPVCQTIHTRKMAENGIDLNETDQTKKL